MIFRSLVILTSLFFLACSSNPHYDPLKKHHTKSGFKNIYYDDDKGFFDFIKWRMQRASKDIPSPEDYNFPVVTHHKSLSNQDSNPSLTWIGHATFLLRIGGYNILTDPQFSDRASPFSWIGPVRAVPASPRIEQLPDIDFIVLSHDHYDSLDISSLEALATHNKTREMRIIAPLGFKQWFNDNGFENLEVIELDWSDSYTSDAITFTAEPSQHWGKRTLFDAYERLWASWVIQIGDNNIFFAGDTGYAPHFKHIGEKYGEFELALLPIGAYAPRWFMKPYHVNPDEAVLIHKDINSKYSVAMHWGTFILTDEPLDEPPLKLSESLYKHNLNPQSFDVFQHGQTKLLNKILRPVHQ